jgi:hypothetical protein
MLTGKRAFEGEDASDTLAGILRGEPDWKALPRSTPGYVRDVLTGCLVKDRKARLADIAVVNYLLSEPRHARQAPTPLLTRGRALAFGAVLLTLVAAVVGGWRMAGRSDAAPLLMRFSIVPGPDDAIASTTTDRQLAISPDGKHIVYVTSTGLALRPVDRLEIQRLSGNAFANARTPFWSPDGKWIGFAVGTNELRKVSVTGGPPVTLCRTPTPPRGATWGPNDTIVFATADTSTGLLSVPAGGGDVKVLTKPDTARGESDHLFPAFLPGGRAVLFTITAGPGAADNMQIAVLNLETGQYKTLVRGGSHPEYVETGHIVYAVSGTLRAVRFDVDRLDVVGDPVPMLERRCPPGHDWHERQIGTDDFTRWNNRGVFRAVSEDWKRLVDRAPARCGRNSRRGPGTLGFRVIRRADDAADPDAVHRGVAGDFPGWTMARVHVRRLGPTTGLCAAVPGREQRALAGLGRRRQSAGVGAEWTRAVLCKPHRDDHGRSGRDGVNVHLRHRDEAVRLADHRCAGAGADL